MQVANGQELIDAITGSFGYQLEFIGVQVNVEFQAVALAIFIVIFIVLNILSGKKLTDVLGVGKKRRKKVHHTMPAAEGAGQEPENEPQDISKKE